MVTHDPVAAAYAERVVFLADGRLVGELLVPDARTGRRASDGAGMRLRQRRAPLLATLAAVALGAALVAACGGLFETALRLDAPPQRFAGADVVVAPAPSTPQVNEHAVALTERPRLPRGLAGELRALPGVSVLAADAFSIALRTSDPAAVRTVLACKSYTGACPRIRAVYKGVRSPFSRATTAGAARPPASPPRG